MPRLTKAQLADIKYVSMADYYNKVDKIDDFADKIKFTSRYLMSHNGENNRDYTLEEAIHLAKMKILETSINKRYEYSKQNKNEKLKANVVDPYSNDDRAAEMFLGNTVDFLKGEAQKNINDVDSLKIAIPEENRLRENSHKMINSLNAEATNKVKTLDQGNRVLETKVRMEAIYGGRAQLEKAYNATKGSFMSRLFGTSSAAAKNLDAAYKAFNNPNHVYYGNTDTLDKAAVQYIQHHLPDWQLFMELPKEEDFADLKETEKARMRFSINTLKCLKDQLNIEDDYKEIMEACEKKDIKYEDTLEADQKKEHKIIDLDDSVDEIEDEAKTEKEAATDVQAEFRAKLKEDLKEDEEYSLDNGDDDNSLEKNIEEEQIDDLKNSK